jgi:NTP pyrophosphatase (non-canonical NTP hydrolase)
MSISDLQESLRQFAKARDWEQFHNPKNLVMALSGEAGELTALFQWETPDAAARIMHGPKSELVRFELADIMIYLLRLADVLGVDLLEPASWRPGSSDLSSSSSSIINCLIS